jgi:hypothetical protein
MDVSGGGMVLKEYRREYPLYSLCGLNCCLCPRYQTNGESKCPGCGGREFHLKHPTCPVVTCNKKHDNVEFCFQCSAFPCKKYSKPSDVDSFISYRNVLSDFEKAERDLESYKKELGEKKDILEFLINNYNDGKRKNFYCVAVNLLRLTDLRGIINVINDTLSKQDIPLKNKIEHIKILFQEKASKDNIELKLIK